MGCLSWLLFAVRIIPFPKELSTEFENRFEEAKLDVFYEQKWHSPSLEYDSKLSPQKQF